MSITGANSIYTLAITGLFNAPVQLQGYAADDAFATEALAIVETLMGVDGVLSGGFVNVKVPQTIMLQADSPSIAIFDQWYAAQQQVQDVYTATGVITLPSVKLKWNMVKGYLTSYTPIPEVKKILQPRKFTIEWQRTVPQAAQ